MRGAAPPANDRTSIGSLLQDLGMQRDELNRAIAHQRDNPTSRLGTICVELGFVDREHLHLALMKQRAMRNRSAAPLLELAARYTRRMAALSAEAVEANIDALTKLYDDDEH